MGKYVNEGVLNSRKATSTLLLTIGSIGLVFWGFCFFAMFIYGELEFIIVSLFFAVLTILNGLLMYKAINIKKSNDIVYMYARFFEGDLDGYIYISDMVNIIGKDENSIFVELNEFLNKNIMINFSIRANDGKNQIVLASMVDKYKCKNCGAVFNKRVSFNGMCPYCNSSDIFADLAKDNQ